MTWRFSFYLLLSLNSVTQTLPAQRLFTPMLSSNGDSLCAVEAPSLPNTPLSERTLEESTDAGSNEVPLNVQCAWQCNLEPACTAYNFRALPSTEPCKLFYGTPLSCAPTTSGCVLYNKEYQPPSSAGCTITLQSWGSADTSGNTGSLLGLGLGAPQGLLGTGLVASAPSPTGLSSTMAILGIWSFAISTTNKGNGINMVFLDPLTCNVCNLTHFAGTASTNLVDFIAIQPNGTILLGVTSSDASTFSPQAKTTFSKLNVSLSSLGEADKLAFVVQIGYPSKTVSRIKVKGDSTLLLNISVTESPTCGRSVITALN